MPYKPTLDPKGIPFGEWLVQNSHVKGKDNVEHHSYAMPYWLEIQHREAALEYLQQTLTLKTVAYLRKGLREWQEASSSKHLCIADFKRKYLFDLYIQLQKILEACYLVLTAEVTLSRK